MPRKPKPNLLSPPPAAAAPPPEPYPHLHLPTPDQCLAVRDALLSLHGIPPELSKYRSAASAAASSPESQSNPSNELGLFGDTVLDGLVSTLLSQNTTESNSRRAFEALKSTFTTWEEVLEAESKHLESAIRCGGLATTKAARIKSILRAVREKRGEICLEYLRGLSVDEVKAELSQFKGIGPKTVACVLMFVLHKDDFPVDTHVYRITKGIGWIPLKADREKAYLHLNKRIPNELKFDLNCLFITHGKLCQGCAKQGGKKQSKGSHASCPLASYYCTN